MRKILIVALLATGYAFGGGFSATKAASDCAALKAENEQLKKALQILTAPDKGAEY